MGELCGLDVRSESRGQPSEPGGLHHSHVVSGYLSAITKFKIVFTALKEVLAVPFCLIGNLQMAGNYISCQRISALHYDSCYRIKNLF